MLAHAGMLEGRHVMQFSMFMGSMRGGSSECTVVVADGPVEAPPVVPHAWAAIAMHPSELGLIERKLRPGSLVLYNRTLLADPGACRADCRWEPVDAGRIAIDRKYAQGQAWSRWARARSPGSSRRRAEKASRAAFSYRTERSRSTSSAWSHRPRPPSPRAAAPF
jgi:hypothetical protein